MMKKQLIFLVAGLTVLISACIYSEPGTHYVDPVPGDPPVISVTTNLDTLIDPVVTDTLEVTYQVEIENGDFYLVEAFMANQELYSSDTTSGAFLISPSPAFGYVSDTLYLYFYYSTNSNSLADQMGLEAHVIDLKYAILFQEGGEQ